jgi:epoxyqueuosine reductase
MALCDFIRRKAKDLGFVAAGFCRSGTPPFFAQYKRWVDTAKYADMTWLKTHTHLKADPGHVLAGCRRVVTLAYPYPRKKPCTTDGLTVSRYARPTEPDYHGAIKKRAKALVALISEKYPTSRSRICVDSAPVLERGFAFATGIGFIGKNNMLIRPGHGSYLFLAEILTTARFPFPEPGPIETLCGPCRRCVEACPTGALEEPFFMNPEKCLSYLTIEKKGPIPMALWEKMGDCFFGCDVCQEVCPFNQGIDERVECLPSSEIFLAMDQPAFDERFGTSAFARAGLEKIKGNIRAARRCAGSQRP